MTELTPREVELEARVYALEAALEYTLKALSEPVSPGQAPMVHTLDHAVSLFGHAGAKSHTADVDEQTQWAIANRGVQLARTYFERANAVKNNINWRKG